MIKLSVRLLSKTTFYPLFRIKNSLGVYVHISINMIVCVQKCSLELI